MSHRTLVRRLALEGLTFSGVLDEMKIDLAKSYLKNDELPISQTAWLLGYGEVSAFTHAFKRWTGMTPRQWRALDTPNRTTTQATGPLVTQFPPRCPSQIAETILKLPP